MFKFRKVKSSLFPLLSTFPERLLSRHRYSKRKSICLNLRFNNLPLNEGYTPSAQVSTIVQKSNAVHESKCIDSSMRLCIQKPETLYQNIDVKQSFAKRYEKSAKETVYTAYSNPLGDPSTSIVIPKIEGDTCVDQGIQFAKTSDQLVRSRDTFYWNLCRSTVRAKLCFAQTLQDPRAGAKKGGNEKEKQKMYTTRYREKPSQYIERNIQNRLQDFSLKNSEKFKRSGYKSEEFVKVSNLHDKSDLYNSKVQQVHPDQGRSTKEHKQERINRLYWRHVGILSNGLLRSASRFR